MVVVDFGFAADGKSLARDVHLDMYVEKTATTVFVRNSNEYFAVGDPIIMASHF